MTQEPGHRVEIEQFGILIGPQHPNTSLSAAGGGFDVFEMVLSLTQPE